MNPGDGIPEMMLSERLGWGTDEFSDACSDLSAILQERLHLELIGAEPFSNTATALEFAISTAILAAEGDTDAARRLQGARDFATSEEAALLEDGNHAAERMQIALVDTTDVDVPAGAEVLEDRRKLSDEEEAKTARAYSMRQQETSWSDIAEFLGLSYSAARDRLRNWSYRNRKVWPIPLHRRELRDAWDRRKAGDSWETIAESLGGINRSTAIKRLQYWCEKNGKKWPIPVDDFDD